MTFISHDTKISLVYEEKDAFMHEYYHSTTVKYSESAPKWVLPIWPLRRTSGFKNLTQMLYPVSYIDQCTKCLNASVRVTPCCLAHVVGSPFPNGNSVGNAIVARPSVLNSLTTLPSLVGQSNGSSSFTVS